jgi:hypothetical protein
MKTHLRKVCSPLLRMFEKGEGDFPYKKSDRKVLNIMAILFFVLACYASVVSIMASSLAGLFPVLAFFLVGLVCAVVGLLGNDRAVSKIWNRK